MKRWTIGTGLAALALLSYGSTGALRAALPVPQQQAGSSAITEHQALINQYCVTCHNQRTKTAGLTLDTMNLAEVGKDAKIWEEAVRKLRGGMMPPPGARQPEKSCREILRLLARNIAGSRRC